MRERRIRGLYRYAALVVALISLVAQSGGAGGSAARARPLHDGPPNVLVIVTDDMRAELLEYMPKTRAWLGDAGTTYTHAFAAEPLCCPSRASVMTGRYPHNHQVKHNGDVHLLDHSTTLQRYLEDAGYRTGLVGKYFIQWDIQQTPPYFDDFTIGKVGVGSRRTSYYGGLWNVNGHVKRINMYSTEFIRRRSLTFLRRAERNADDTPWFLYVAPAAPHKPVMPAEKYVEAPVPPWQPEPPSLYETDRSDKPTWVQDLRMTRQREKRAGQIRMLMSVDDMVDSIMRQLEESGEADNTLIFFTSDHGYFWGEHGAREKGHPYHEGVAVPLAVRWPGHIDAGEIDDRLVSLVDIAPTVMEAVELDAPMTAPMDGRSLLSSTPREEVFIEFFGNRKAASWAALRTDTVHYIEYYDDATGAVIFREYYDMVNDPWQMTNLLGDADTANDPAPADLAMLTGLIEAARVCKGPTCP